MKELRNIRKNINKLGEKEQWIIEQMDKSQTKLLRWREIEFILRTFNADYVDNVEYLWRISNINHDIMCLILEKECGVEEIFIDNTKKDFYDCINELLNMDKNLLYDKLFKIVLFVEDYLI